MLPNCLCLGIPAVEIINFMHKLYLLFHSALCLFPSSEANYPPCTTCIAYIGKFGNGIERRFTSGRSYYEIFLLASCVCGLNKLQARQAKRRWKVQYEVTSL
jgi:hypothetical protein